MQSIIWTLGHQFINTITKETASLWLVSWWQRLWAPLSKANVTSHWIEFFSAILNWFWERIDLMVYCLSLKRVNSSSRFGFASAKFSRPSSLYLQNLELFQDKNYGILIYIQKIISFLNSFFSFANVHLIFLQSFQNNVNIFVHYVTRASKTVRFIAQFPITIDKRQEKRRSRTADQTTQNSTPTGSNTMDTLMSLR